MVLFLTLKLLYFLWTINQRWWIWSSSWCITVYHAYQNFQKTMLLLLILNVQEPRTIDLRLANPGEYFLDFEAVTSLIAPQMYPSDFRESILNLLISYSRANPRLKSRRKRAWTLQSLMFNLLGRRRGVIVLEISVLNFLQAFQLKNSFSKQQ